MSAAYGCGIVEIRHALMQIAARNADIEPMASVQALRVLAQLGGYIETRGQGTSIQVTGDRVIVLANPPDMPGFKARQPTPELPAGSPNG